MKEFVYIVKTTEMNSAERVEVLAKSKKQADNMLRVALGKARIKKLKYVGTQEKQMPKLCFG